MKWINASERLPDKDGMYITKIRVIEEGLTFLPVAYNRFKFKEWENPSVCNSKGEIIEWLDESPDPKDQRISELEQENERLSGLVEKAHAFGWTSGDMMNRPISVSWQQFREENKV